MCAKIPDRHLSRQQESDWPCEQSKNDQRAANGFDHAGRTEHRRKRRTVASQASEGAEELLPAVEREGETDHDASQRSQARFIGRERRHFESHGKPPYHERSQIVAACRICPPVPATVAA